MFRRTMRALPIVFCAAACAPASAEEARSNIRDSIAFEGKCRIQIAEASVPCNNGAALFRLVNDRTIVIFGSPAGMFTVAGAQEKRIDDRTQALAIDTIRFKIGDHDETVDSNMEGECRTSTSADGSRIEAIRCAVRDKVKKAKFSFDLTDITTAKRTVVTGSK
ncbi:MAG: hypothetical protein U1E28_06460 [Beijerinckiaceae bacterium]